ncbi:hypothetical protein [Salmonella phage vB_SenS_SE1]|uniref:Uncharacterized protein n=1 Tax=Salmonella phage vB_SenS_SE1 TaxID=2530161 RepID=A0A481W6Z0_9CAUD|nr:hypothetical protein PF623_gp03 [Salmonella phage vB_SenS_SE1]QBJ03992.1 hypothetical protein [Salmonella phage vB_SenS_SE1]
MSLATDILKRANSDLSPPSKSIRADYMGPAIRKKAKRAAPKGPRLNRKTVNYVAPKHEHVAGVAFNSRNNTWDAYFYNGVKTIRIGMFHTQARALIARRIYMYWRKCGFDNIPNKPERRLYTMRNYSDKS